MESTSNDLNGYQIKDYSLGHSKERPAAPLDPPRRSPRFQENTARQQPNVDQGVLRRPQGRPCKNV